MSKTFLNKTTLDAAMDSWNLEEPVSEPNERGSVIGNYPVWTVDYSVTVPEAEATMQRLCTDAHFLYQVESAWDVAERREAHQHSLPGWR